MEQGWGTWSSSNRCYEAREDGAGNHPQRLCEPGALPVCLNPAIKGSRRNAGPRPSRFAPSAEQTSQESSWHRGLREPVRSIEPPRPAGASCTAWLWSLLPFPWGKLCLLPSISTERASASPSALSSRAAGPRCLNRAAFPSVGPGCAGEGALAWLGGQTTDPTGVQGTRFNLSQRETRYCDELELPKSKCKAFWLMTVQIPIQNVSPAEQCLAPAAWLSPSEVPSPAPWPAAPGCSAQPWPWQGKETGSNLCCHMESAAPAPWPV